MSHHAHTGTPRPHHHAPPDPGFSLLRASVPARLALAASAAAALWLAVAVTLGWI